MKKWEKDKKSEKSKKDKIISNKIFKPIKFQKIENIYKAEYNHNKTNSIILFKKTINKKTSLTKKRDNNIKVYNYSKSNEKKTKTLNNTFSRKNKSIKNKTKDKNNISKSIKRKILTSVKNNKDKDELKLINKGMYSPINKTSDKNEKILFFTENRNKTPKKSINIYLIKNNNNELSLLNKNTKNKKIHIKYRNTNTDYNSKLFIMKNHIKQIILILTKIKGIYYQMIKLILLKGIKVLIKKIITTHLK